MDVTRTDSPHTAPTPHQVLRGNIGTGGIAGPVSRRVAHPHSPRPAGAPQPLRRPAATRAGGRYTSWPVGCDLAEVGRVRHRVTAQLHDWGLEEDLTDTVELLVSELVTNALRYAPGPVRLNIRVLGSSLRCEVEDTNPARSQRRTVALDAEGGRGTVLLDALTEAWASTSTPTGKTTWFTLALPDTRKSRPRTAR
ncbi:ATP-binding protein [Streptomyces coffeae]|uniref:ATP-binding protein n=1 Tax=Streptomyces coffeae TaxID=621382 RepID=A0ABS1NCQ4_9ACTN|nr:ATP-binding protein [Streptomyces coffeae]MBL1097846.1 ATP-binding protein [Streptomyces coffeae]